MLAGIQRLAAETLRRHKAEAEQMTCTYNFMLALYKDKIYCKNKSNAAK